MKTMKRNIIYLLLAVAALYTAGCKKDTFLQDGSIPPDGAITEAQEWANPDFARNFLNNVYASLQSRYNLDGDGSMLASGSDEAVNSNLNSSINIFNNGTWSPVRTIDDTYSNMYSGIRKANIFLVKANGSAVIPASELQNPTNPANPAADLTYDAQITRLRGQAFFLRAYFEFELVKRYGSMVLVTRVLNSDENLDLPRNSFDDCVKQIVADCDSAADRLPDNAAAWNTTNRGRATKIAAQALKARLLLYAASPQYNTSNDVTKWQAAATAAKTIIDGGKAGLYTSYPNIFLWNISGAAYNTEVIFATQTANDASVETNNAPISYNGASGRTDPTQNLVDAFEMKTTGRTITDPLSGYSANAPYTNRDPRLGFAVMLNGSTFQSKTVDIYAGGKDAIGVNVNATKTGYYMRKFLAEAAVWNTSSNTSVRKPWVLYRYAEVLLNYAEAVNEAQGTAGMAEVLKSLNLIRARSGVAMPALQTTNAAGNGYVAPTQAELRKRIHLERQVELCFEEHRFYDVRRWKEGETTFSQPARGMNITQTTPGVFAYAPFTVETRTFTSKNYLFPIAQVELNKAPALKQNPGY